MDKETMEALAEQAGVRFFGSWIEGSQAALYRFAELILAHGEVSDEGETPVEQ